jgi:hypothetical protein
VGDWAQAPPAQLKAQAAKMADQNPFQNSLWRRRWLTKNGAVVKIGGAAGFNP